MGENNHKAKEISWGVKVPAEWFSRKNFIQKRHVLVTSSHKKLEYIFVKSTIVAA